jgi:hypothetical protein
MPKTISTNYSATNTDFPVVTGTGNALLKEDLYKLQAALHEHTHDATRGLPVRRLNTADAPAGTGQVRINGDALQWWGASAGAVQSAVSLAGAETLTNKTLVTPTVASLTNAQHSHQNAAGGGALDAAAITGSVTGSGSVVKATSPTLVTPTIASFANATHDHSNAAGGGSTLTSPSLTSPTVSSGQLTLPAGSAASPSLVFDSGNGVYSEGADRLDFATAGVRRAEIDASGTLLVFPAANVTGINLQPSNTSVNQPAMLISRATPATQSQWLSFQNGASLGDYHIGRRINSDTLSFAFWNGVSLTDRAGLQPTGKLDLAPDPGIWGIQITPTSGQVRSIMAGFVGGANNDAYLGSFNNSGGALLVIQNGIAGGGGGDIAIHPSGGHVRAHIDTAHTLGTASFRWAAVYALNGTIQTSRKAEKDEIGRLDPERALAVVRGTDLYEFTYTGHDRRHVGFYAEEADELLSPDHESASPQTTASVGLAALKALADRVDALSGQVAQLEAVR